MLRFFRQKDFFHPFAIWLIILIWYLIIGDTFFFTPRIKLDNFITNQSFWFFSQPPEVAKNITIVTVDQSSRNKLELKWPWKRSITAELIQNIASFSPKIIGLDIIFSGNSEEDEDNQLIAALKSHPKIILGYILNENSREKPIQEFIDGSFAIGFVNRPLQEGVIKEIRPFFIDSDKKLNISLEVAILQAYFGLDKQDITVNEKGVFLKDKLFIPCHQGTSSLNYLVYPSNFTIIPASSVLDKEIDPADFRNKIVLVGATDPIIHDEYPTPLGIFPRVTIIGNSLVMLLSGRFLHDASILQCCLFAFFIGLLILFINKELDFFRSSLVSLFVITLTYFSFIYLRAKDITFSYFFIFFSGITAYMVLNLYKYLNLIYISNRIKKQAIFDPATGLYTWRYFLLQLDEKVKLKQSLGFVGLRIRNYKKLSKDLSFEQVKLLINLLSNCLSSEVKKKFRKFSMSCLSTDTLGILFEADKKEKIETFVVDFLEESQKNEWELGDKKISYSLQACLIFKSKNVICKKCDLIFQMENLFEKIKDNEILTENIEEVGKEEETMKISSKDSLDFIVYDWEERNKDLERNIKEILEVNKRLDKLNWGTLTALARAIDAKSPWTAGHSERVTHLALKIGRILGLTRRQLDDLQQAGLLHDIGKIGIPAGILDKPGKLTDEEYRIICEHPEKGAKILQPIEEYAEVIPVAMQHHEWFNGKGYPDGLSGEKISFGARILAVADVFDALTSDRPYRDGMPIEIAAEMIRDGSGTQFDPKVVEAFLKLLEEESVEGHTLHMGLISENIEAFQTI